MEYVFFGISFFSSVIGAICGIGGGIIIKPVLDSFAMMSISSINFLSGCTVLAMSVVSVTKAFLRKTESINVKTTTLLALGAVGGGMLGKTLFEILKKIFENENTIGFIQSVCMLIITLGTIFFTLKQHAIQTFRFKNPILCICIGLVLGLISSFLGIGGGPVNIVALVLFFSMRQKEAALNSIFIILFSQSANLMQTLVSGNVPPVHVSFLLFMAAGGVSGGFVGSKINKTVSDAGVKKLFLALMIVIVLLSAYNMLSPRVHSHADNYGYF